MGVSTDEAMRAVRARLDSGGFSFQIYNDGDPSYQLPDVPATFGVYVFDNQGSDLVAFGGGRGQNVYRNRALANVYVFTPAATGSYDTAATAARPVADHLRSYRDDTISIFKSDVFSFGPGANFSIPGLAVEVSNYNGAVVEAFVMFDQIG
jgi:hypothetical protein